MSGKNSTYIVFTTTPMTNSNKTKTAFTLHTTPKDVRELLDNHPKLLERWNALTPLARNEWVCYVTIVKKEETRTKHLKRLEEEILRGKKRPCCWPGCPHRRPNAAKWFA
jgi:Bacteriocin-protection, YdeI or OmpD-Associated